jgi:preprotein translocase subunit YajC
LQGLESLIFLGLLIVVFYFMLIRPQKRRVEQHKKLIDSVGLGDEVVTIGGMYGTVRALRDDEVEIEISPGTTARFIKSAIGKRVSEPLGESVTDGAEGDESA